MPNCVVDPNLEVFEEEAGCASYKEFKSSGNLEASGIRVFFILKEDE